MAKKQSYKLLEEKLAHLGLVMICEKWNNNPFDDLGNEFIKVSHSPRLYWEKRRSPMERENLLVDLAYIRTNDSRSPWLQFYLRLAKYNEKHKMGISLHSELSKKQN